MLLACMILYACLSTAYACALVVTLAVIFCDSLSEGHCARTGQNCGTSVEAPRRPRSKGQRSPLAFDDGTQGARHMAPFLSTFVLRLYSARHVVLRNAVVTIPHVLQLAKKVSFKVSSIVFIRRHFSVLSHLCSFCRCPAELAA